MLITTTNIWLFSDFDNNPVKITFIMNLKMKFILFSPLKHYIMNIRSFFIAGLITALSFATLYGQQSHITNVQFRSGQNVVPDGTRELVAGFIGQHLFGEAPLWVKFIDQSQGGPQHWLWEFGDGTTDTVPISIHTYQQPGVYTVRLTVWNETDTSGFKRIDYVKAMEQGGCDSLNYPLPGEYALYTIMGNGSGYISGNSSFGTLAKASYFDDFEEGVQLMGGVFAFAVAKRSATNNIPVWFKVWDVSAADGHPGNVIDSVSVLISKIVENVEFGQSTLLLFEEPVNIEGPFFLGLELPRIYGDTLALYTNNPGDVEEGNAWTQDSLGVWMPYSEAQWSLNVDHALFPITCQPLSVENHLIESNLIVYPLPAGNTVNFTFTDATVKAHTIRLFDMTGRIISVFNGNGKHFGTLQTGQIAPGFYFLKFDTSNGMISKKIIIR